MRKSLLLLFILLSTGFATGQITIAECYAKAQDNYPLIKQYNLIEQTKEYNLSNAGKGYLPRFALSAKATYQSEVTEIPIPVPGIEAMSRDQYNASVELSQTIWDGGEITSRKESIRSGAEVNRKNLEVSLYAINERVNQLYFAILLFDARTKQNELLKEQLQRNADRISAAIQNGVANGADLDAVKVELLKAEQTTAQLYHSKEAYLKMLSIMTGMELTRQTTLVQPDISLPSSWIIQRPELDLFAFQIKDQESKNSEINASLMPRIKFFVQGGVGRPGLNMLKRDLSAYYIGGINVSWNFGALYTQKNSRRMIQTAIHSIEAQREAFVFNTNINIAQQQALVEQYRKQLSYDDEIIRLRGSVRKASEEKLANGTVNSVDLMRDVVAESTAMQEKIAHETELMLAIYNLRYTTNN